MSTPTDPAYPRTLTKRMLRTLHDQVDQLAEADPNMAIIIARCVDLIMANTLSHQSAPKGGR